LPRVRIAAKSLGSHRSELRFTTEGLRIGLNPLTERMEFRSSPVLDSHSRAYGAQSPAPTKQAGPTAARRYQPNRFTGRAGKYYELVWGVDSLAVKWTESGEVIRFTYRVLDADKAKTLNDKKAEPSLIDPQAQVKLVVPSMEKVGQLRQSSTPQAGKSYWMAFSNKGRLVKRGSES